jgi:benzylsuccinate CoA-transferase BbsF subunit
MTTAYGSIFAGVRIADFSWVIAAPLATQYLAIHGAEVIRIESGRRLDTLRTNLPMINGSGPDHNPYYASYNMNKLGLRLNLRNPKSLELVKRLIAGCDAVVENFTPGTLDRLGLGYDALREVRPDLVVLSMALGGQTGPERSYKGFGTVIQGSAGITHLTGWPDRPPAGTGVAYTDFFAGPVAASVLIAALLLRRETGLGQHIDLSQQEASLYALDAALLQQTVNGQTAGRQGNRHPSAAPHGVYPCVGDDRWLAIAVFTDEQWHGLVRSAGEPRWARQSEFETFLARKAHEDELDRLIAKWTSGLEARAGMELLQSHGVPAGLVEVARDLTQDPQLLFRRHFLDLHHPIMGDFPFDSLPYRVDGEQPVPAHAAPTLGQDNRAVLEDLVGLSRSEYAQLESEGAFD